MSPDPRGPVLTFGAGAQSEPEADLSLDNHSTPRSTLERRAQPLPPARRARQRRRAAQRRSRARMREGSEALLAFLVLAGLTLLLIDVQTEGRAYDSARSAVASVFGPLQAGADSVVAKPTDEAPDPAEQQRLLAEQSTSADQRRLAELEQLFGLVGRSQLQVIGASVVALDARRGNLAATIDRGAADQVSADQAALAGNGLVGKVETVGSSTSVVQLTADARFAVGVRLVDSGEAGIVRGTGDPGRLVLEVFDPLTQIKQGEQVVTIGSPRSVPFPPGLVVGTVTDPGEPGPGTRTVEVAPAADLTKVSVLAVLSPPASEGEQ